MKTEIIEELLERYFNGETSSKEEKILGNYFNSSKVDPKLEQYQVIFKYFASEKNSMKSLTKRGMVVNFRKVSLPLASVAAAAILLVMLLLPDGRAYRLVIGGNNINNQELAMQIASKQLEKLTGFASVADRNVGKLKSVAVVDKYFGPSDGSRDAIDNISDLLDKLPGR
ncbi:MAG: hypothetical protein PHT25_06260 [Bacteroidales bacterium]|nr:hypothetical protein [Bacteroidales bacterium]